MAEVIYNLNTDHLNTGHLNLNVGHLNMGMGHLNMGRFNHVLLFPSIVFCKGRARYISTQACFQGNTEMRQ